VQLGYCVISRVLSGLLPGNPLKRPICTLHSQPLLLLFDYCGGSRALYVEKTFYLLKLSPLEGALHLSLGLAEFIVSVTQ
jgi:hypothetical protein